MQVLYLPSLPQKNSTFESELITDSYLTVWPFHVFMLFLTELPLTLASWPHYNCLFSPFAQKGIVQ